MTRLQQLLLFILDRAQRQGKPNLSRFQLFKIFYMLQVYSLKFAGTPFILDATFIREKNGPICIGMYKALEDLEKDGYIKMEIKENKKYGHSKHAFSLKKNMPKLNFDKGEMVFLDNFLTELLPLTQAKLKAIAYATEPMLHIQKQEKDGSILKGKVIDFNSISVDPDIVDVYSDEL